MICASSMFPILSSLRIEVSLNAWLFMSTSCSLWVYYDFYGAWKNLGKSKYKQGNNERMINLIILFCIAFGKRTILNFVSQSENESRAKRHVWISI